MVHPGERLQLCFPHEQQQPSLRRAYLLLIADSLPHHAIRVVAKQRLHQHGTDLLPEFRVAGRRLRTAAPEGSCWLLKLSPSMLQIGNDGLRTRDLFVPGLFVVNFQAGLIALARNASRQPDSIAAVKLKTAARVSRSSPRSNPVRRRHCVSPTSSPEDRALVFSRGHISLPALISQKTCLRKRYSRG